MEAGYIELESPILCSIIIVLKYYNLGAWGLRFEILLLFSLNKSYEEILLFLRNKDKVKHKLKKRRYLVQNLYIE